MQKHESELMRKSPRSDNEKYSQLARYSYIGSQDIEEFCDEIRITDCEDINFIMFNMNPRGNSYQEVWVSYDSIDTPDPLFTKIDLTTKSQKALPTDFPAELIQDINNFVNNVYAVLGGYATDVQNPISFVVVKNQLEQFLSNPGDKSPNQESWNQFLNQANITTIDIPEIETAIANLNAAYKNIEHARNALRDLFMHSGEYVIENI